MDQSPFQELDALVLCHTHDSSDVFSEMWISFNPL
jgi:hypothetical protein